MTTRERPAAAGASLARFTSTAQAVASDVIDSYSTSFGMATRLLGKRHRTHVRNIYAMVRVADELVDGVALEAGLTPEEQADALATYIAHTHQAMKTGYSPDLIIHAFAHTARESGIGEDLTQPFFDSMRADLADEGDGLTVFDEQAHEAYVYGSAEVVGLMCLRVFLRDSFVTEAEREQLEYGARRLGVAFQNVNFLRDLADDTERLGRDYLGVDRRLTVEDRDRWVAAVRAQLADAAQVMPLLPADARVAVRTAHSLFANLTNRVARTAPDDLYRTRIRVPGPVKLALTARCALPMKGGRRA